MSLYCAIDLHSTNNVPVVIDDDDTVLFEKRLPNDLSTVIAALKPFKQDLHGVAVESTFNWYWLVDGLADNDFNTLLVNPSAVKQYDGVKHTNDESDAFHLAHLMRLGILPTGYIYPRAERAVRDLLRKRLQLVRHRVTHMLSAQNQIWRSTGLNISSKPFKQADFSLLDLVDDNHIKIAIKSNLTMIQALNQLIDELECTVLQQLKLKPEFLSLLTIDGIGNILGMTIMLETGDINRFASVANFSSYARCVDSSRLSNGKKKGANNRKNGNKYLSWAFVEAAHSIIRHNKTAHKFYQRKRAQKNGALATKALAHKLARVAYHVMRNQEPFQLERLFR
jgi:transposase